MPVIISERFKGKEFYFDLRPEGIGEEEGFWAVPVFDSDMRGIEQAFVSRGGGEGLWIELLVFSLKRWAGFKEPDGTDFPCTAENIRMLCNSDPSVMRNVLARIQSTGRMGVLVASKN